MVAGERFKDRRIRLHLVKELSARDVCCLCHEATLAGMVGVDDLGMRPRDDDADYNDHLKLVLVKEYQSPDLYYSKVPLQARKSPSRVMESTPFNLPSEALVRG